MISVKNFLPAVVLGLNPAWQKTLIFEELRKGQVNRATSASAFASGKGINFCRAAQTWGYPTMLLQFLGGDTGSLIKAELELEKLHHNSIEVKEPTRICTTCLSQTDNSMTELIEPSGLISEAELEKLHAAIRQNIAKAAGLAICGTFPPGINETTYRFAIREAQQRHLPILLDSWKDIPELLKNDTPDILKINVEELSKITGETDPAESIRAGFRQFHYRYAAITDGGSSAWFSDGIHIYRLQLPEIAVVNPVGAGDTVSAVMFGEYLRNVDPLEAFAQGLAAASASCLELKCAVFDPGKAAELRREISIYQI